MNKKHLIFFISIIVIFTSDAFTSQYYYLKEKINWEKFYGIL